MDVSLFVLLAYFCDVFVLNNYKNLKNLSESVAFFFYSVRDKVTAMGKNEWFISSLRWPDAVSPGEYLYSSSVTTGKHSFVSFYSVYLCADVQSTRANPNTCTHYHCFIYNAEVEHSRFRKH